MLSLLRNERSAAATRAEQGFAPGFAGVYLGTGTGIRMEASGRAPPEIKPGSTGCCPALPGRALSLYSARFRSKDEDPRMHPPLDVAALDVVGIGNAIVDVIAHADERFLRRRRSTRAR